MTEPITPERALIGKPRYFVINPEALPPLPDGLISIPPSSYMPPMAGIHRPKRRPNLIGLYFVITAVSSGMNPQGGDVGGHLTFRHRSPLLRNTAIPQITSIQAAMENIPIFETLFFLTVRLCVCFSI